MIAVVPDFRSLAPIVIPVGLGMAALGLLLPRPRQKAALLGAALGGLALAFAAVLLLRVANVSVEAVLFYSFAGLALVHGGIMITQANPARAALAFAMVVLSTCGLFLLNAAPFLMAGTVIIYAGAIVVTFLFVLMLAQPDGMSDADRRSREPILAVLAGFFLLSTMLWVVRQNYGMQDYDEWLDAVRTASRNPGQLWQEIGKSLPPDGKSSPDDRFLNWSVDVLQRALGRDESLALVRIVKQKDDIADIATPSDQNYGRIGDWLNRLAAAGETSRATAERTIGRLKPPEKDAAGKPLQFSQFAGAPPNRPVQPLPADNVGGLGRTLFTDYLLAVELGGTLLLVATIGAIAITKPRSSARRAA